MSSCPKGFSGERCQNDDCANKGCAINATCAIDVHGNANCICTPDKAGTLCTCTICGFGDAPEGFC